MPVYSMTGFGSASAGGLSGSPADGAPGAETPTVTVEFRSVNSRFLDISFRMPDEIRQHEAALRELVAAACKRGKVDVRVSVGRASAEDWPQPAPDQLNRLSRLEGAVLSWLPATARSSSPPAPAPDRPHQRRARPGRTRRSRRLRRQPR